MTLSKNESDAVAPLIAQVEGLRGTTGRPFNINGHVWVRLTKTGRILHKDYHVKSGSPYSYEAPKEQDGWSRWQLWHLMEVFGPHIYHGSEVPFETDLIFSTK